MPDRTKIQGIEERNKCRNLYDEYQNIHKF